MQSLTYLKNLKITPKKLRFFLPVIKKMTPEQAVQSLMYSPEKPARIFYKVIQSAIANAQQTLKVGGDLLQFKLLTVEEGQKLRRYKAGGRGTAKPIMRRYAHIKIILEESQPPRQAAVKAEAKTETERETKSKLPVKKARAQQ